MSDNLDGVFGVVQPRRFITVAISVFKLEEMVPMPPILRISKDLIIFYEWVKKLEKHCKKW